MNSAGRIDTATIGLDGLPFPCAIVNASSVVVYANRPWVAMALGAGTGHDLATVTAIDASDVGRVESLLQQARTHADASPEHSMSLEIDVPNLGLARWSRWYAAPFGDDLVLVTIVPIRSPPALAHANEARVVLEDAYAYISEGVVILDKDFRVVLSTGFASNLMGRPGFANEGLSAVEQIHPGDLDVVGQTMERLLSRPGEQAIIDVRIASESGDWRWFEAIATNLLDHPAVGGILVLLRDIGARKDAEAVASRLVRVFDESPDLVSLLDQATRPIYRNTALRGLLASRFADPADARRAERTLIRDVGRRLPREVVTGRQSTWQGEIEVDLDGGLTLSLVVVVTQQEEDSTPFIAGIARDITDRKQLEAKLAHQASHDSLTDLPNRATFLAGLAEALTDQAVADTHLAVLFLDLDNLKDVNDSVGHHVGDALLIDVAKRLRTAIRPFDVVSRLGGDEFAVLCRFLPDEAAAHDVAERVRRELTGRILVGRTEVFLSASIGIVAAGPRRAILETAADDAMALLRDADTAMYRAKQLGRARVETFTEDLRTRAQNRRQLTAGLEQALLKSELYIDFQPIISLADNRIASVEALLRWRHPSLGELAPASFIDLAEESGLIEPIGRWAMATAIRDMASISHLAPDLTLHVNVSPRQLAAADDDFAGFVAATLTEFDFAPERLTIEITESTLLDDAAEAATRLDQVRDLGVRTAIDDFGTGYSSLAYLRRFAMNELKLDGTFVQDLHIQPDSRAVVKAVIDLAHSLRMTVTAEAVSETAQLDVLRELGCDRVQGFLLGTPMSLEELTIALGR